MEQKTKIAADNGRQEITITREFELPIGLLFKACTEPDLIGQWMGTNVLKFDGRPHGSYRFETTDPKGNKHGFNGTFHQFIPNQRIIRTFEMEGTPYGVQLEIHDFEPLTDSTSKLTMHVVYESVAKRDQILQLPFRQGINMAHNRIEQLFNNQE